MARSALQPPAPSLRFDRQVVPDLRIRLWAYESTEPLDAPACAHDTVELAFIDRGSATYRVGRGAIEVPAGAMVLVPSTVDHATGFGRGLLGGAIHFDDALVDEARDALGSRSGALEPCILDPSPRLRRLVAMLVEEAEAPGPGSALSIRGLSDAIVVEALRRVPLRRSSPALDSEEELDVAANATGQSRRARDARIRRAIQQIEASLGGGITVDDLAKTAGMSRFHFSRLFREETGESPYRYVLLARLGRAVTLLRSGRHGVTEAAYAAGFTDLGRFHRLFRERFGHSPGALAATTVRARLH